MIERFSAQNTSPEVSRIIIPDFTKETGKNFQEKFSQFDQLMSEFEKKHDLDLLYKIESPQVALSSPERKAAKDDLIPIVEILNILKEAMERKEISADLYIERKRRYAIASNAVGFINNGRVRHG